MTENALTQSFGPRSLRNTTPELAARLYRKDRENAGLIGFLLYKYIEKETSGVPYGVGSEVNTQCFWRLHFVKMILPHPRLTLSTAGTSPPRHRRPLMDAPAAVRTAK